MRAAHLVAGLLLAGLVLATSDARAKCDPAGADAADVAAARAAIAAACDCEGATNHGAYVRCARAAAKAALTNKSCLGKIVACAARSTCGRPGAVACCQTNAQGKTRASIKAKESACRATSGGTACVSPFSSACDACTPTGCAALPTPTPTPPPGPTPTPGCGNGLVDPGEECDAPTCTADLNGQQVQATCGAPGSLHACECRSTVCGGCVEMPGTGALCWADDECAISPSGFPGCPNGTCVPTTCETPADCTAGISGCENGLCCIATFGSPGFCRVTGQFELPCCGAAVCGPGSIATCCLPAGEQCTGGATTCCSGSCTGGTCD